MPYCRRNQPADGSSVQPYEIMRFMAENTRQQKVARLIQRELATYFQQQTNSLFNGRMVTVTVVRISPDLSVARVYFSVFPSSAAKEVLEIINQNNKNIRFHLGQVIRHQVRIIPELSFFIDDSLDYYERIDNLLKKK